MTHTNFFYTTRQPNPGTVYSYRVNNSLIVEQYKENISEHNGGTEVNRMREQKWT